MDRVSGELYEELFNTKEVTWKIPNVFDLPNAIVDSAPFTFANGTWCLRMFTCGKPGHRDFDMELVTVNSSYSFSNLIRRPRVNSSCPFSNLMPRPRVSFEIYLKTRHGEHSHHYDGSRSTIFLEEAELHARRATLAPNNTLTICCQLRTPIKEDLSPLRATNGQLSDESFTSKKIVWKIPNIFGLPNSPDHCVRTPTFTFANATWSLLVHTSSPEAPNLELGIVRLNSDFPEQTVFIEVYVETDNGAKLFNLQKCMDFHGHQNGEKKQFPFLEWVQLRSRQSGIAPADFLRIVCYIRTQGRVAAQNQAPVREYSDKVFQDLRELLQDEESTDVTMQIGEEQFRAHKLILSARSPVFASMFRGGMREQAAGIVEIDDCDPSTFPDFLRFLYCGDLGILTVENVFSLYITGDKYQVQDLRSECVEFMKRNMTVDIFCDIIGLFLQSPEMNLTELTTDFFAVNWETVTRTEKWKTLLQEHPLYCNELLNKILVSDA